MWKKLILLAVVTVSVCADLTPRRLYKYDVNDQVKTPFEDPDDGVNYRLPNNTIPLRYEVSLSTDIHRAEFAFTGRVRIRVRALELTNNITLHQRQLTIHNISLQRDSGAVLESAPSYTFDTQTEFLVISPRNPLTQNMILWVTINYSGTLRSDEAGFYRSSYLDVNGVRRYLATTQFESTDARHAFPCYDEPGIRSVFSISIRHHFTYNAISNMPVTRLERESASEYAITHFDDTPLVHTYLIAFIVSDFYYAEDLTHRTPQRIYAKPYSIQSGHYHVGLNVSGRLLDTFEQYLNTPFTLPKMDQAAIPDFSAGAMENWGLVTYREVYLLFNPSTGTTRNQENIETVIAHEFAHQHFGNLVGPAWWHYLWLNEGFATLYENFMVHLVFPEGRWMDSFLVDTFQPVMVTDANPNVRAMTYYIESPRNIDRIFDSIAYSKSGSMLRMFQNAFGDETWRKGLYYYMTEMKFRSAISADLYAGLQKAVDEDWPVDTPDVAEVMGSWELQAGLPYVTVKRDRFYLLLSQNRFLYTNRTSENLYWVPICYRVIGADNWDLGTTADDWIPGTRTYILNGTSAPHSFGENDLVLINYKQSGYYRVLYDVELWDEFIEVLGDAATLPQIPLENRAQLIDDSLHFARADLLDYDILLGVMSYLSLETDYLPWNAVNRVNTYLFPRISGSSMFSNYREFMRRNVEALFNRLGVNVIPNEPRVDRYTRIYAMNIACSMGLESCLNSANFALTESLLENLPSVPLHQDVSSTIYCNGIRSADRFTFDAALSKALRNSAERAAIMTGLGCTHDMKLLTAYFDFALQSTALSATDRNRVFSSAYVNGEDHVRTMIDYVDRNYVRISAFSGLINTVCGYIASRIGNQEMFEDFGAVLDKLAANGLITAGQRATHGNNAGQWLAWQETYLGHFERFFNEVV